MAATPSTDDNNSIKGLLTGWGLTLTGKPCDNCNVANSLLYCNTDSAFLCGPCDAKIHPPTRYPRHERIWVCEVCDSQPAVVFCKADGANLCSSCDHDIHSANPLARRHERVAVIPFLDSPIDAVAAPSSAFLVPDNLDATVIPSRDIIVGNSNDNTAVTNDSSSDDADAWLIPNPNNSFLYSESDILNYNFSCSKFQFQPQNDAKPQIIVDDDTRNYAFADSVVPSQSQGNNNNFAINNNSINYVNSDSLFDNCFNIDFTQPNKHHKKNHNNDSQLLSPSFNYSVSSSDIGVVPDGSATSMSSEVSYGFAKSTAADGGPLMDREARVLRYREKRKNRKFEKTIRYASRKAYAETRPRVKGRFTKRNDTNETSGIDFAVDNGGYGVVPAF
ncbi:zinc finger protein CONSTANS-LIKE 5-like [Chenopodium quinoa]|uniref:zinc finger protein CONSTANS-LIKE 5-like n=1 Tax=Chenopodium quinoa TaxID=63459 RepID=UPI000B78925B|nr:zinc finger protein CONSTANS-LIKE 5-like [Chenopodium quinoa]